MARSFSTLLQVATRVLHAADGFLVFVQVPLSGGDEIRLVRNTAPVNANSAIWEPCSLAVSVPEEDAEGSLGEMSFTIPNVSLQVAAVIESGELDGALATVWIQNVRNFAAFDPAAKWTHRITEYRVREPEATFGCKHPADPIQFPIRTITRKHFARLVRDGGGVRI